MSKHHTAHCKVRGFLDDGPSQELSFALGSEIALSVAGDVGPQGISSLAADLLDVAATVFQIERHLKGRNRTNPPSEFRLTMAVRNRRAWSKIAVALLEQVLRLLGSADWRIDFRAGSTAPIPAHNLQKKLAIQKVALFSGGFDSTCGVGSMAAPTKVRCVSFYTGQKSLQTELANSLGMGPPLQWTWAKQPSRGRGTSYYYRSFLFLCLAAAVAESYACREVIQFENGVLAFGVPPDPSFRMTRHAHPELHRLLSSLFGELWGGEWKITNPLLFLTKRDARKRLADSIGIKKSREILLTTETCWALRSPKGVGGKKDPGTACGACVPCLVRRTALSEGVFQWDLMKDSTKNHPTQGAAFRAYYGFLQRASHTKKTPGGFFRLLDGAARDLVRPGEAIDLRSLQELYLRFGNEFAETYL